jgi:hypothetical protein
MNTEEMQDGAGHAPNKENSATLYRHDTNLYKKDGCELQQPAEGGQ